MSTDEVEAPIVHGTISVSALFVADINGTPYGNGPNLNLSANNTFTGDVTFDKTVSVSALFVGDINGAPFGNIPSLSANNTFYGNNTFTGDVHCYNKVSTSAVFVGDINGAPYGSGPSLSTNNTFTANNTFEANVSVSNLFVGDINGAPYGNGPSLNENNTFYGNNTFLSNVYSADYKNLSGQKIIVSSSTAFDPTEDERTGTMKAIRDYIGTLMDIEPPTFAGGHFTGEATGTVTASVGETFNPFTDNGTITCTDSPTAGPNKGTTQTFTLGAEHFEFRNAAPGTTVVPMANVFDNLDKIYGTVTSFAQKGTDINEPAGGSFGTSIALSSDGTIIAVGAPGNDGSDGLTYNIGRVRVYQWTSGSWTELGQGIYGEAGADQSGISVALSSDGTILAVGAHTNSPAGLERAGHVRVYQWSGGSWTQLGADIDGEADQDESGWSVALSSDGTILAVGAKFNDGTGSNAGHVRVYQWTSGSWTQLGQDIDGENPGDNSGISVALSSDGTILAVGANKNHGTGISDPGHVRVYQWSGGSWTQLGADIDGEADQDESGWSVALSSDGTILAVGAKFNDGTGSNAGHVRVYQWTSGSWTQLGQDIDGEQTYTSTTAVALSSDGMILAVGSHYKGYVRVYQWTSGLWTQLGSDIVNEATSEYTGWSVALSSDGMILAVGAKNQGAGRTRVYQWSGGSWTKILSDIDGETDGDQSGASVALSSDGTILAIGAPQNNGSTGSMYDAGHARVFDLVGLIVDDPYWQPSSTWKTAGTYYLRYKATDAAGNETPNDASHYLTVTVE